jgi:hypothetical protein
MLKLPSDIVLVTKEEFNSQKEDVSIDIRIKTVVAKITIEHECFFEDYKYYPIKDQNFKMKYHNNIIKRNKHIFDTNKDEKYAFSLLNKLTNANHENLTKQILDTLAFKDISMFVGKLLDYSENSDLFTELICKLIRNILEKHQTFNIEPLMLIYYEKYLHSHQHQIMMVYMQTVEYDNYDDFCDYKKCTKMKANTLRTIINMLKTFDYDEEYVKNKLIYIYKVHIQSLIDLNVYNDYKTYHLIFDELFLHIEILVHSTSIMCNDLKILFNEMCDLILEKNTKLKFKIMDIKDFMMKK